DNADTVDERIGPDGRSGAYNRVEVEGVDKGEQALALKKLVVRIGATVGAHGREGVEAIAKRLVQLVAEHAGGAEDQDTHKTIFPTSRLSIVSSVNMNFEACPKDATGRALNIHNSIPSTAAVRDERYCRPTRGAR